MNATRKTSPSAEGQRQLDALRQAVGKTLEKKRRLGQYAVTWKGGRPVVTGDDAPGMGLTSSEPTDAARACSAEADHERGR
ncbi:hypothetical protein BDD21_0022 [Thiocapsa rosea]|uniref:Uncharacterized protein n=1 Tax=Thiocapsa rosea TaxID=69360 RepID=A0A495UZR7_9GAMM|nr:hypothetical protein BDD21_0022 [Thiocapsa rosea]